MTRVPHLRRRTYAEDRACQRILSHRLLQRPKPLLRQSLNRNIRSGTGSRRSAHVSNPANPKGRPKKHYNVRTVVEDILSQRITIREGQRSFPVNKFKAIILTITNAALKGDPRAQRSLLTLLQSLGMMREAEQNSTPDYDLTVLTDEELETIHKILSKAQARG
jgi:hypothetical protein